MEDPTGVETGGACAGAQGQFTLPDGEENQQTYHSSATMISAAYKRMQMRQNFKRHLPRWQHYQHAQRPTLADNVLANMQISRTARIFPSVRLDGVCYRPDGWIAATNMPQASKHQIPTLPNVTTPDSMEGQMTLSLIHI